MGAYYIWRAQPALYFYVIHIVHGIYAAVLMAQVFFVLFSLFCVGSGGMVPPFASFFWLVRFVCFCDDSSYITASSSRYVLLPSLLLSLFPSSRSSTTPNSNAYECICVYIYTCNPTTALYTTTTTTISLQNSALPPHTHTHTHNSTIHTHIGIYS